MSDDKGINIDIEPSKAALLAAKAVLTTYSAVVPSERTLKSAAQIIDRFFSRGEIIADAEDKCPDCGQVYYSQGPNIVCACK